MLIDANLLIYATMKQMPQHAAAKAWLERQFNGPVRVGLCWDALLAFVRITTNPRAFDRPLSAEQAMGQVADWIDLPNVWIPLPTEQHAENLKTMIRSANATANLIHDAHLAALAFEHGLTLYSTDTGFARFPGLRWNSPLSD